MYHGYNGLAIVANDDVALDVALGQDAVTLDVAVNELAVRIAHWSKRCTVGRSGMEVSNAGAVTTYEPFATAQSAASIVLGTAASALRLVSVANDADGDSLHAAAAGVMVGDAARRRFVCGHDIGFFRWEGRGAGDAVSVTVTV